jgi:hypothetical protein
VIGGIAVLLLVAWLFGKRSSSSESELPPSSTTKFRPPRSSDRSARLKQQAEKKRR